MFNTYIKHLIYKGSDQLTAIPFKMWRGLIILPHYHFFKMFTPYHFFQTPTVFYPPTPSDYRLPFIHISTPTTSDYPLPFSQILTPYHFRRPLPRSMTRYQFPKFDPYQFRRPPSISSNVYPYHFRRRPLALF